MKNFALPVVDRTDCAVGTSGTTLIVSFVGRSSAESNNDNVILFSRLFLKSKRFSK